MLENTKPLFSENKILTVHNLYTLRILTETFKVKKFHSLLLIDTLLPLNNESNKQMLLHEKPKTILNVAKNNFAFKAAEIWNKLIPKILHKPEPKPNSPYKNTIIEGSCPYSDLTTPINFIKITAEKLLHDNQCSGSPDQWLDGNANFYI